MQDGELVEHAGQGGRVRRVGVHDRDRRRVGVDPEVERRAPRSVRGRPRRRTRPSHDGHVLGTAAAQHDPGGGDPDEVAGPGRHVARGADQQPLVGQPPGRLGDLLAQEDGHCPASPGWRSAPGSRSRARSPPRSGPRRPRRRARRRAGRSGRRPRRRAAPWPGSAPARRARRRRRTRAASPPAARCARGRTGAARCWSARAGRSPRTTGAGGRRGRTTPSPAGPTSPPSARRPAPRPGPPPPHRPSRPCHGRRARGARPPCRRSTGRSRPPGRRPRGRSPGWTGPSTPCWTTSVAATSRIRSTRRRLRSWLGTRRVAVTEPAADGCEDIGVRLASKPEYETHSRLRLRSAPVHLPESGPLTRRSLLGGVAGDRPRAGHRRDHRRRGGHRPGRHPAGPAAREGGRRRGRRRDRRAGGGPQGRPPRSRRPGRRGPRPGRRPGAQPHLRSPASQAGTGTPSSRAARSSGRRRPTSPSWPGGSRCRRSWSTTPATASTSPRRPAGWSTPARSRRTRRSSRTPASCSP